jgi:hypothetical protein
VNGIDSAFRLFLYVARACIYWQEEKGSKIRDDLRASSSGREQGADKGAITSTSEYL